MLSVKRALVVCVGLTAVAGLALAVHADAGTEFACHYYTEDKGCEYDAVFTVQVGPATYCRMRFRPGAYEPSWCEPRPSLLMRTPTWRSWWMP